MSLRGYFSPYMLKITVLNLFLSALVFTGSLQAQEDLGPRNNLFKIHKVLIQGVKKVEKEAILEKISSKEGMVLDNYVLRKDIQKIYSLKYFEAVEAHQKK